MANLELSRIVNVGRQIARAVKQVLNSNKVIPRELVSQLTRNQDIKLGLERRIAGFDFENGCRGQSYLSLLDQLLNCENENLELQHSLMRNGRAMQADVTTAVEKIAILKTRIAEFKQSYLNHLLKKSAINQDKVRQENIKVDFYNRRGQTLPERFFLRQRELAVERFQLDDELALFGLSGGKVVASSIDKLRLTSEVQTVANAMAAQQAESRAQIVAQQQQVLRSSFEQTGNKAVVDASPDHAEAA